MNDRAAYEIADGTRRLTARFFDYPDEPCELTPEEIEADDIIGEGFCSKRYAGKVGYSIDLYKAAEEMPARHYGNAKTIEADCSWKPNRIRH